MKRTSLLVFILIALCPLFSMNAYSQADEPLWEVIVYLGNVHGIATLTPEGVTQQIAVPDDVFAGNMSLSADQHWLAFAQDSDFDPTRVVYVADLAEGTCCTTFDTEYTLPDDTTGKHFRLIGFGPEGSQLALDFSQCIDPECLDSAHGAMLVDMATMNHVILRNFDLSDYESPVMWSDDGIVLTQQMGCMEGDTCLDLFVLSSSVVRDLQTGENVSSTPAVLVNYVFDHGDHLPLTGEYISEYSFQPPPGEYGPSPYSPVTIYYSPEMDRYAWEQNPSLIYLTGIVQGTPDVYLIETRWVLDGNAVFIRSIDQPDHPIVLMRDGTQQMLDVPPYRRFLVGTTDGWLMYDTARLGDQPSQATDIFRYRYSDGEITTLQIAEFESGASVLVPVVLESTPLGASVTELFATVAAPSIISVG